MEYVFEITFYLSAWYPTIERDVKSKAIQVVILNSWIQVEHQISDLEASLALPAINPHTFDVRFCMFSWKRLVYGSVRFCVLGMNV